MTELEWTIEPLIAEWAEVASFDAPGVGVEPPARERTRRVVAERGIEEIERRGWDRCVVAGDEFGAVTAALLASLVPERVAGVALGHASLSLDTQPPRPALMEEVLETFGAMIRTSYRAYARSLSQLTKGSYDDEFVEEYIARIPQDVMAEYESDMQVELPEERVEHTLAGLDAPLLLAEHLDCLLWTHESFEDITARFPDARTCVCSEKPSVSPVFAEALRGLCQQVASGSRAPSA